MQNFSEHNGMQRAITVSELNQRARELIERTLPLMWIAGEVSNFTRAASGHCYFVLKDAQAQVRCVFFRHKAALHDWQPSNGMQIEVRAVPSFYEARGEFQLNVETMRRSGLGALYEAFEKLKAKLQAEGLFDERIKRRLPPFPKTVGVVTSLKAAALRDVLTTLKRRMPSIQVVIYPTAVQGENAGLEIAKAITTAGERMAQDGCEALIVCRGGGSIEDLWAFNEEVVARAIRACPMPVVSGVGHETDFTIADFVADVRATTPTAAAELVSPNRADLEQSLQHWTLRLMRVTERALERRMQQLDVLARRLVHPGERIAHQQTELGHLATRLRGAWRQQMEDRRWQLQRLQNQLVIPDIAGLRAEQRLLAQRLTHALARRMDERQARIANFTAQLAHLNPQAVLQRGYSLVENATGEFVRDSAQLKADEEVKLTFAKGSAHARVTKKN